MLCPLTSFVSWAACCVWPILLPCCCRPGILATLTVYWITSSYNIFSGLRVSVCFSLASHSRACTSCWAGLCGCLGYVFGYRVRLCASVLFVIAVSTYRWNFLVIYVDDAFMHLLLFWFMLLPCRPDAAPLGTATGMARLFCPLASGHCLRHNAVVLPGERLSRVSRSEACGNGPVPCGNKASPSTPRYAFRLRMLPISGNLSISPFYR